MKELIEELREYDVDYPAFELMDKAANAIEILLSEKKQEICTSDAVDSLRARLAKYEDAEGRPAVVGDCAQLIQALRGIDIRHAMGFVLDITGSAVEALESQAREIERLKDAIHHKDAVIINMQSAWSKQRAELAALKAQPSAVVLPELNKSREQWARVDARICAHNNSAAANMYLIQDAQNDIERLHRAFDAVARLNPSLVSDGGVDERAAFEAWHNQAYGPQDKYNPIRSLAYDSAGVGLGYDDPTVMAQFHAFKGALGLTASAPNHSEQVREGWQLVPVEPTPEMLAAVTTSKHEALRAEVMRMAAIDYRAMLAAAPSAGSQEQG